MGEATEAEKKQVYEAMRKLGYTDFLFFACWRDPQNPTNVFRSYVRTKGGDDEALDFTIYEAMLKEDPELIPRFERIIKAVKPKGKSSILT